MSAGLLVLVPFACGGRTNGNGGQGEGNGSDDAGSFGGGIATIDATFVDDDVAKQVRSVDDATTSQEEGAIDPSPPAPSPPFDAGPDGICTQPLAPGDLMIDELMIESVAGAGDHGEWIEIASTLDCAIDIKGLHGDCPRGAKVASFDVGTDTWIVVADSKDPAVNHDLPGTLVAWLGQPGDVLRNKGTTVTLRMSGGIVDSITYPTLPLTIGASLAFPAGCEIAQRSDWSRWQPSTASWFPGFFGTPNAPNTDVSCP